ncbi:hypothetical protein HF888_07420 [Bermanella marisrubri]|uniref:Uncharacterized protein n=1 Tax=Bermanella marisrubri TaxID=207949 RepID=Q1N4X1_9GAMM|nr:hypothetical protein [Bermanella marisrubri]EAT13307.1 hypothetical protein RED65_01065 [Oceanobacter sp. RED65] [Bermanella marisrubri]QIZ84069.1 hypothetical protein HF888_07420 [Bermanella marisrubri]
MKQYILVIMTLYSVNALAQVEELSNSEMTEAYIKDGNIVVKQKPVKNTPQPKQPLNFKVGPGEPIIAENEKEQQQTQQQYQQRLIIEQELPNTANDQLTNYELQNSSVLAIPTFENEAARQQREYAQNLVREGLNLPADATITNQHMAQYLNTFQGQSSGSLMGPQQTITADGFEFIIPNPGNYPTGVYSSGNGTVELESTNQQLIFKLLYPKTVD